MYIIFDKIKLVNIITRKNNMNLNEVDNIDT